MYVCAYASKGIEAAGVGSRIHLCDVNDKRPARIAPHHRLRSYAVQRTGVHVLHLLCRRGRGGGQTLYTHVDQGAWVAEELRCDQPQQRRGVQLHIGTAQPQAELGNNTSLYTN